MTTSMLSNTDALAALVEAAEGSLISAKARLAAAQQHKKELGDKVVATVTDYTKGMATRADMSAAVHELSDQQSRVDFRINQIKANISRLEARISAFNASIKAKEAEAVVLTHLQLPDMAEAAAKKLAEIRAHIRETDAVSVALLVQSGQAPSPVAEPVAKPPCPAAAGAPVTTETKNQFSQTSCLIAACAWGAEEILRLITGGVVCRSEAFVHLIVTGQRQLLVKLVQLGAPIDDHTIARVQVYDYHTADFLRAQKRTSDYFRLIGLIK